MHCYSKSPMITKVVYVVREWTQFISPTADLKLLRQISTVRFLLKKRHSYLSKISWLVVYLVIDKEIPV